MESVDLSKELDCSICQKLFIDPVTLRCGHNFCRECVDRALDTQKESGAHSCPECREEFPERPALIPNITLSSLVGKYRSSQVDSSESGIFCTYCVDGSPVPAVRSCLLCEASLCDKHLRVHSKSPEHILTDPTASLEDKKCSIHKRILEYYCIQDAACICVSCSLAGDHRGHQVEMLEEASEKKKMKLSNDQQKFIKEEEELEKRSQSLQKRKAEVPEKVADLAKRVKALFGDHRRQLDDLERKVVSDLSRQEEQLSCSLTDLIKKLNGNQEDLSRRRLHMGELCNETHPLTVLRDSESGHAGKQHQVDRDITGKVTNDDEGGHLNKALVSETLRKGLYDIGKCANVSFYMEEPSHFLLDVNTAGPKIGVSEDLKEVSWTGQGLQRSQLNSFERFQTHPQVLSSKSFQSGRHYWEVEIEESVTWKVGMCYASIERKGDQSAIGYNPKSWCLHRRNNGYSVIHDSKTIRLHGISSNRVRVCLDYEAGQLSFYELSDPTRHLHTFTTTFTEPLHAMLGLWNSGSIILSHGM